MAFGKRAIGVTAAIAVTIAMSPREASGQSTDPIRVIEAVTAGVAFLAAGAIFRSQGDGKGLTTGAGMWLAGAIGVACGAGYGILAIMATVLAAIILVAVRWIEGHFKRDEEQSRDAT